MQTKARTHKPKFYCGQYLFTASEATAYTESMTAHKATEKRRRKALKRAAQGEGEHG